jgi:hypothetical protein
MARQSGSQGETNELQRLRDLPNWGYLLQEFAELYRRGKAGGSARSAPTSAPSAR